MRWHRGRDLLPMLGLLGILGAGFAVRVSNRDAVFADRFYAYGNDAYYHLRRMMLCLASYPRVPDFDAYANYPDGLEPDWPPGFDVLLATVARLAGAGVRDRALAELVAAWTIPVLGTVTILIFYLLARTFLRPTYALLAALVLALCPAHAAVSMLGETDHHVMEALCLVSAFTLFAWGQRVGRGWSAWGLSAASGLVFAVSFLFWLGSGLFVGVFWLCATVRLLVLVALGRGERRGTASCAAVLGSAFVGLLVGTALVRPKGLHEVAFWRLSLFHVLFILFLAVGYGMSAWLASWLRRLPRTVILWCVSTAGGYIALAAIGILVVPGLRAGILRTLEWTSRNDVIAASIEESVPLLTGGLRAVGWQFTGAAVLFPPALAGLCAWLVRYRFGAVALLFLVVAAAALCVPMLKQLRFGAEFAPAYALVLAAGARVGSGWMRRRGLRRLLRRLPGLAVVVGLAFPSGRFAGDRVHGGRESLDAVYPALEWLRDRTPSAGDPMRPDVEPLYGVMSHWDFGHDVLYVAGRPNIANPLSQTPEEVAGVVRSMKFLTAESEDEAYDICLRLNVRYVLSTPTMGHTRYMLAAAGRRVSDYCESSVEDIRRPNVQIRLRQRYFRLMAARLHLADGLGQEIEGARVEPLAHFRLLYESPGSTRFQGRDYRYAKVFEVVRGARLVGRTTPGTEVTASLALRTVAGRELVYRARTRADQGGRFSLTVPYATDDLPHRTRAAGGYFVNRGYGAEEVAVHERAILAGSEVALPDR